MRYIRGIALLALVAVVGLSCKDNDPGRLTVRLVAPPGNAAADSALVITINSPAPLTSATAGPGLRLFQQALGGNTTRFALVGPLSNQALILTIGVVDAGAVSQYNGTVDGVALANFQLRSVAGYALAITR